VFAVTLRADQIVSGTAINFLALGITGFLYVRIYGEQGTPDDLPDIPDVHLPIGWIPFLGEALEQLNLMIWLGLILTAVLSMFLFRTTRGLRLRSVGENPLAADTAGISPIRVRYWAVMASGAFAALGGVFLSIGFIHSFSENMTQGKGFIALAVVIVGKWKPGPALAAALLFGFSSALAQRLPVFSPSTATLLQALPYVLTLIAVAGLVGRSRPPAADGIPYKR
jgi:general nucleoside transport system permease protein